MGDLGTKIREKRLELNMSIKDLAVSTGLTSGFISQVERNHTEPSITSLRKMAKAMDVAVFHFFMEEGVGTKVVRRAERTKIQFPESALEYELLSPDLNRKMEMFYGSIEPGGMTSEEPMSHNGEEVVLVLKGIMTIIIGDEEYTLTEGDSIYYLSNIPHQIKNLEHVVLEFISTITPPRF